MQHVQGTEMHTKSGDSLPEGKTPLKSPMFRQENKYKMDLKVIRLYGVKWIHLAQDRGTWWNVVNPVMKSWSLCNNWNFWTI